MPLTQCDQSLAGCASLESQQEAPGLSSDVQEFEHVSDAGANAYGAHAPVMYFGLSECVEFFRRPAHAFVGVALYKPYLHYDIDNKKPLYRYLSVKFEGISLGVHSCHKPAEFDCSDVRAFGHEQTILPKQLDVHVSLGSFLFRKGHFKKVVNPLETCLKVMPPLRCICTKNMCNDHKRIYYLDLDDHCFEAVQFFKTWSQYLASSTHGDHDARTAHHISFYREY